MRISALALSASIVLIFVALMLIAFPDFGVLAVAAFTGTLISLTVLFQLIQLPSATRISWLLAGTLLFGYVGGATISYLLSPSWSGFVWNIAGGRPIGTIAPATSLVLIPCGILFLVGALFEAPFFRRLSGVRSTSLEGLTWALLGIVAIAYFTGQLNFMGANAGLDEQAPVLGNLALSITPAIFGYIGWMLADARQKRKTYALLFQLLLVAISAVPLGRRIFIIDIVIFATAFSLAGGGKNWGIARKFVLTLLFGILIYGAFAFFFVMRLAGWQISEGGPVALVDRASTAISILASPQQRSTAFLLLEQSSRQRTFVLGYYADLNASLKFAKILEGQLLANSILISIPSALYPNKNEVLRVGSQEKLANPAFHLPLRDEANSILTDGISDFGVIGIMLYPIGLVIIFLAVAGTLGNFGGLAPRLFILFSVVGLALSAESALVVYFASLRNSILVWALLLMAERLPRVKLRPRRLPEGLVARSRDQAYKLDQ